MALFNKKKKEPDGPYARIEANVKYEYFDYYCPEVWFFDTEEDYINGRQKVYDRYKENKEIERVIWNHYFRGCW